jgi:hypothetical protein
VPALFSTRAGFLVMVAYVISNGRRIVFGQERKMPEALASTLVPAQPTTEHFAP